MLRHAVTATRYASPTDFLVLAALRSAAAWHCQCLQLAARSRKSSGHVGQGKCNKHNTIHCNEIPSDQAQAAAIAAFLYISSSIKPCISEGQLTGR
jgi:hypothetical protein